MTETWTEPQLIVINRGAPEEAVLGGCKGMTGAGPLSNDGGCGSTASRVGCNWCDAGVNS